MAANKYSGACESCGGRVPAFAGTRHKNGRRWVVRHAAGACAASESPHVTHTRFYGGSGPGSYADVYQNSAGRCEDAPCCGCCS